MSNRNLTEGAQAQVDAAALHREAARAQADMSTAP